MWLRVRPASGARKPTCSPLSAQSIQERLDRGFGSLPEAKWKRRQQRLRSAAARCRSRCCFVYTHGTNADRFTTVKCQVDLRRDA